MYPLMGVEFGCNTHYHNMVMAAVAIVLFFLMSQDIIQLWFKNDLAEVVEYLGDIVIGDEGIAQKNVHMIT